MQSSKESSVEMSSSSSSEGKKAEAADFVAAYEEAHATSLQAATRRRVLERERLEQRLRTLHFLRPEPDMVIEGLCVFWSSSLPACRIVLERGAERLCVPPPVYIPTEKRSALQRAYSGPFANGSEWPCKTMTFSGGFMTGKWRRRTLRIRKNDDARQELVAIRKKGMEKKESIIDLRRVYECGKVQASDTVFADARLESERRREKALGVLENTGRRAVENVHCRTALFDATQRVGRRRCAYVRQAEDIVSLFDIMDTTARQQNKSRSLRKLASRNWELAKRRFYGGISPEERKKRRFFEQRTFYFSFASEDERDHFLRKLRRTILAYLVSPAYVADHTALFRKLFWLADTPIDPSSPPSSSSSSSNDEQDHRRLLEKRRQKRPPQGKHDQHRVATAPDEKRAMSYAHYAAASERTIGDADLAKHLDNLYIKNCHPLEHRWPGLAIDFSGQRDDYSILAAATSLGEQQ